MLTNLFKKSGIYFSGLLISKIVNFVVYILLARFFLPEKFGTLVLFFTLIQIVTVFADFGLNQWYQKRVDFESKELFFSQIIMVRFFTLFVSIVISFLILRQTSWLSSFLNILFVIALIPEALVSITDGYYLEKGKPLMVAFKGTSKMIVVYIGFLLSHQSFTINTAIIFYILGSIVTTLWSFPWFKVTYSFPPMNSVLKTLRKSGSYALLILTSFAYARGDTILIRVFLTNSALGIYGSAYRYLESLALLPTALSHNLFPLSAKKTGISLSHLIKIFLITAVIGLIISSLLYVFSDFLIIGILGETYRDALPIMQIFSLVVFLFFINAPLNTIVISSDHLHQFVPWGIGNTILNLALNILLLPIYGIVGAALAMLVTEITGFFLNSYFVFKLYRK